MSEIIVLEESVEANLAFPVQEMIDTHRWCAYLCAAGRKRPPPFDFRPAGEVYAEVNHSRWIVKCPHCMGGAMLVSRRDPLFWCVNCRMVSNRDWPMAIVFPKNADDFEYVLSLRSDPATRNWSPAESIDHLRAENCAHGLKAG